MVNLVISTSTSSRGVVVIRLVQVLALLGHLTRLRNRANINNIITLSDNITMVAGQTLYPRATVKRTVKSTFSRNLGENVAALLPRELSTVGTGFGGFY